MPLSETFVLRADDGAAIACRRWLPGRPPIAVVQIAHGLAEHSARYDRLANALVDDGYAVYSHDHRGHGDTATSPDDLGHFESWDGVVEDIRRLGREARSAHPSCALVLIGHSMGSFMTQEVIASFPRSYDAYVLSGSSSSGPISSRFAATIARIERRRLGARGRSKLLGSLFFGSFNRGFGPEREGFEWLSRDPSEVATYVADPRCGFESTTGLWSALLGGLVRIARPDLGRAPRDLPIYLFAGDRDPVGNRGKGVRRLARKYERAGLGAVHIKLYPDGRHEMVNEINREQVTADLRAWLRQNVAPARIAAEL